MKTSNNNTYSVLSKTCMLIILFVLVSGETAFVNECLSLLNILRYCSFEPNKLFLSVINFL